MIFVSSTYQDLAEHRQVLETSLSISGMGFNAMEHFGATPSPPLQTCLDAVEASDIFVVRAARKLDQYAAQKVDHLRAFILCGSDRATVNLIPPSASSRQREPAWAGERPPRTAELHASM